MKNIPNGSRRLIVLTWENIAPADRDKIEKSEFGLYHLPCIRTAVIKIRKSTVEAVKKGAPFDWLVFISPRAVTGFLQNFGNDWPKSQIETGAKIAVIGQQTGKALEDHGLPVHYRPREADFAHLAHSLPLRSGQQLLLVRGNLGRKRDSSLLRARGALVIDIRIYATQIIERKDAALSRAAASGRIACLVFASPSAIRGAQSRGLAELSISRQKKLPVVVIGKRTLTAARRAGYRKTYVAKQSSFSSLVDRAVEIAA